MKNNRVVVTGLGVISPTGTDLHTFENALKSGTSGIRILPKLKELNFRCQVGGVPPIDDNLLQTHFSELERRRLNARGIIYGALAALQAWNDAGLPNEIEEPRWNYGTVFGTGMSGINTLREAIYKTDEGKVKRLGSSVVEQTMPSGISAWLGGKFGLGNRVTTNASACSTGTESVILAYEHIKNEKADLMIAGGCDADGPHVWGGFDAMRVLTGNYNDEPESASRPMSATASGFVPGSGGAALILESLTSATERGAKIYGEIIGSKINSGGQRMNGSMTAPNSEGVRRCIKGAIDDAGIDPAELDLICGHLTSTMGDVLEVENWSQALNRTGKDFPYINSLKSTTGHCLSAAGAMECVASLLQLNGSYIHPNKNCQDPHPKILELIDEASIPTELIDKKIDIIAKSSFGFGDVNSCIIFKSYLP